jgi:hypothetical protein
MAKRRNRIIRKPGHLPEADESAEAVRGILEAKYGETDWVHQVVESVRGAVNLGVTQLSTSTVHSNELPLTGADQYRFEPRTNLEQVKQAPAGNPTREEVAKVRKKDDEPPAVEREHDDSVSWVL